MSNNFNIFRINDSQLKSILNKRIEIESYEYVSIQSTCVKYQTYFKNENKNIFFILRTENHT